MTNPEEYYDVIAWACAIVAILGISLWTWAYIYFDRTRSIPWYIQGAGIVGVAFGIITTSLLWQVLSQPFDI